MPLDWVNDVLYGPGNEMTQIKFVDLPSPLRHYTETRSYNSVRQITQILTTDSLGAASLNLQFVYSATQNNGQIAQSIRCRVGRVVNTTLIQARAPAVMT